MTPSHPAGRSTLLPSSLTQGKALLKGTHMTVMLSRFLSDAQTRSLLMGFNLALAGSVFAFLALIILLH